MSSTNSSLLRLGQRAGYRFSAIAKRLNETLATAHAPKFSLSINNWKLMSVIEFYGPLSATELGRRTSLDADKITRSVDSLVRQGFVIRRQDDVDRRRIILSLSPKGKRVHDVVEQFGSVLELELLSVLNEKERAMLDTILAKLDTKSSELFAQREDWFERRRLEIAGADAAAVKPKSKRRQIRPSAAPIVAVVES